MRNAGLEARAPTSPAAAVDDHALIARRVVEDGEEVFDISAGVATSGRREALLVVDDGEERGAAGLEVRDGGGQLVAVAAIAAIITLAHVADVDALGRGGVGRVDEAGKIE